MEAAHDPRIAAGHVITVVGKRLARAESGRFANNLVALDHQALAVGLLHHPLPTAQFDRAVRAIVNSDKIDEGVRLVGRQAGTAMMVDQAIQASHQARKFNRSRHDRLADAPREWTQTGFRLNSVATPAAGWIVRGMLTDLLHVVLLALLGTGHCIGMCGAFAVAAGTGGGGRARWWGRQIAYQLGKGVAYVFVGIALLAALKLIEDQTPVRRLQDGIGWGVGGLMILFGLGQLFARRLPQRFMRWWQGSAACGVLHGLGRSSSPFKGLLIGWINGFLPCGLSLAALLFLVGSQSAATVAVGALAFSLATLPGLAATAWLLPRLGRGGRVWLTRATGLLLIALGALTIARGRDDVHHWFHQHLVWPSETAPAAEHEHPMP